MRHCDIRNSEQALAYIVDCTLATVGYMATLKNKSKSQYKRQIAIAQKGCDWMRDMNISPCTTRAEDIINIQSVEEWAKQFEPKK